MRNYEKYKNFKIDSVEYDPNTGAIFSKYFKNPKPTTRECKGYRIILQRGNGKCISYYSHIIAYIKMTGNIPNGQIDHINGVKNDNRWSNLRVVSRSANQQNRSEHRRGKKIGISYSKGAWVVYVPHHFLTHRSHDQIYLGRFSTQKQAEEALYSFCIHQEILVHKSPHRTRKSMCGTDGFVNFRWAKVNCPKCLSKTSS